MFKKQKQREQVFTLDRIGKNVKTSLPNDKRGNCHVKTTKDKIELESKHGTSWKELSYSLAGLELKRVVVNEYGIQSEVVAP